jgi:alkylation response protein AidB-like acyl-CoA dehydrogenase
MQTADALAELGAEEFRTRLRSFLTEHHPGKPERGGAARLAHARAWASTLADHGFAGPAWPRRWGGMELPLDMQIVYHDEITRAAVPSHPSPTSFIVAPTLIVHGTDTQRERYLRPLLRADEIWCQGFSEPGAGSDLASLTTRAERDGDFYVVTGQKLWTTYAAFADWMFALVRTGEPGSRQDGISYLLNDIHSPGVDVRPLRDMTGGADFNEVFFDGVRVPVDQRVGDEHGGWAIARTSLGHERATAFMSGQLRYRRVVDELVELARERGAASHPVMRQRLAAVETAVRVLGWNGARVMDEVLRTGEPGPAGSVNRLLHATFEQRLHELALDILGADGMLAATDPRAPQRGRWTWGFLRTRASTIGAGTAEIQRSTIGERTLGLPREPDAR